VRQVHGPSQRFRAGGREWGGVGEESARGMDATRCTPVLVIPRDGSGSRSRRTRMNRGIENASVHMHARARGRM